ncbi:50S ribosomal protein L30 [Dolosigranulum savutiense]|uniref:Large ribosomal subunit protein uL30 n=1 Tax=Dolosigranulum savutiense TaxID=3110288 RepID=A0AB74TX59_9LACT
MANLQITLKKSLIGRPQTQHKIIQSLGLKRLNSQVIKEDNAAIRGAINKVQHLVEVQELD